MTEKENWLRVMEYGHPQWIPCSVSFSPITWHHMREDLEALVLRHPRIFRDFEPGGVDVVQGDMGVAQRLGQHGVAEDAFRKDGASRSHERYFRHDLSSS